MDSLSGLLDVVVMERSTVSVNQNLSFSSLDSAVVVETVPSHCEGDVRKLLASMQSSWMFFSFGVDEREYDSSDEEVEDSVVSDRMDGVVQLVKDVLRMEKDFGPFSSVTEM